MPRFFAKHEALPVEQGELALAYGDRPAARARRRRRANTAVTARHFNRVQPLSSSLHLTAGQDWHARPHFLRNRQAGFHAGPAKADTVEWDGPVDVRNKLANLTKLKRPPRAKKRLSKEG